jgi:transposase
VSASTTSRKNHTRGLLAEYGIVLPQGPWRFIARAPAAIAEADLSDLARTIFGELLDQLDHLDRRIKKLDAVTVTLCRTNEACRRLAKLPGVGPVVATAIVATVNEGRQFRSGREMAAWIGLVPRQYTTGGKSRRGGIGRRANHYLRRQMIHGARVVVSRLPKHADGRATWLQALVARRGFNRTIADVVCLAPTMTCGEGWKPATL